MVLGLETSFMVVYIGTILNVQMYYQYTKAPSQMIHN